MILGSCILTEIARRATTSRMEESYIQKKKTSVAPCRRQSLGCGSLSSQTLIIYTAVSLTIHEKVGC
jgi:hypothetical protein